MFCFQWRDQFPKMDTQKLRDVACAEIDKNAEDLAALSNVLWTNPELALEEFIAHDALTTFLDKQDFDKVEKNFVLPTGFRAVFGDKSKGPHVAIMSEFDALPGIGHACGHNLIAEVGVAAALGVKAALKSVDVPFGQVGLGKAMIVNQLFFASQKFSRGLQEQSTKILKRFWKIL